MDDYFMIKRAAGPSVSARIPASREGQALLKAIVFNVLRVIGLGRVERLRGGFQWDREEFGAT